MPVTRVTLPRIQLKSNTGFAGQPQVTPFDPAEENRMRELVEQAFERLVIPASGGGGGGGGDLTAKYILDTVASDLPNAFTVHRALGPDRVPASPNAMDDEMLDATTGYDSSLWTLFSHGSETYGFDEFGGLVVHTHNDSTVRGIEQAFDPTGVSSWCFTTKVCLGLPGSATNGHAGLMLRQASNGYIRMFTLGLVSGVHQLNLFEFSSTTSYSDNLASSNALDHVQTGWVYLRIRGGSGVTNTFYEYSLNGVAWRTHYNASAYPDAIESIGLINMQFDSGVGPVYFQFFRRTV